MSVGNLFSGQPKEQSSCPTGPMDDTQRKQVGSEVTWAVFETLFSAVATWKTPLLPYYLKMTGTRGAPACVWVTQMAGTQLNLPKRTGDPRAHHEANSGTIGLGQISRSLRMGHRVTCFQVAAAPATTVCLSGGLCLLLSTKCVVSLESGEGCFYFWGFFFFFWWHWGLNSEPHTR
jgi:hypothetical protein